MTLSFPSIYKKHKAFVPALLQWYEQNYRPLPWRSTTDPYKIWLSEIILQQTRVRQGMPYYERFIQHYSSIEELAAAPEQEVLRMWQGLGYYSRARNLLACARQIVADHGGKFPSNYEALKKLPGIGEYTAAAIASFSFQEPVPVVDGNVFRVLSRICAWDLDIAASGSRKQFFDLGKTLIPPDQPGAFNQAIMEFGALHCRPVNPDCEVCFYQHQCEAYQEGRVSELPVKLKKTKVKKLYFYYFVIKNGDRLALNYRDQKGIWKGMYDFHLIESEKSLAEDQVLEKFREVCKLAPDQVEVSTLYEHILSHRKIFAQFFTLEWNKADKFAEVVQQLGLAAYSSEAYEALPKPRLVLRFLNDHEYL